MKRIWILLRMLAPAGALWMMTGWALALYMTPWDQIRDQRYFELGYFNTIMGMIQPLLVKTLLWTLPVLIVALLLLMLRAWRRRLEGGLGMSFIVLFLLASTATLGIGVKLTLNRSSKGANVIVIVVDTLRADHTSMAPGGHDLTPLLKKTLMPDAVYFPQAYSTAPWTLPSVASLMTSRYPSSLQVSNLVSRLQDAHLTMAEIFTEQGYATCGIISHLLLDSGYGFRQGFEQFNNRNISDEFSNHASISSPGVTRDAIQFVRENRQGKFFLMMHLFDPHYIYLDHDGACPYEGNFTTRDVNKMREWIRSGEYRDEDIEYLKCCYRSEIRFTDGYLHKFIEELKSLGLYEDTVIVFTADHGEEFLERGRVGHSTTLYSELVHIPLMIKPPKGLSVDLSAETAVSNLDVLPTVMGFLGLKAPAELEGDDLRRSVSPARAVVAEVNHRDFGRLIDMTTVVSGRWKMIHDLANSRYELYDLGTDPGERVNCLDLRPPQYASLKMALLRWEEKYRNLPVQAVKQRKVLTSEEEKKLKSLGYL